MRKLLFFNVLFILLVSCSNPNDAYHQLENAEKHKGNMDSVALFIHAIEHPDKFPPKESADYCRLFAYTQFYSASAQLDDAIFDVPLSYYKTANDVERQYEMYILGGTYWFQEQAYEKSLAYLDKGYQLAEQNSNDAMIDRFCELLGGINMEQKRYDVAIDYFKKRVNITTEKKAEVFYDLALNYAYQGHLDSVVSYMEKSFEWSENVSAEFLGHRMRNYADILYGKRKYDAAIEQLRKAEKMSDGLALSNLYTSLSLSYLSLEQLDSASLYFDKAKIVLEANRHNSNSFSRVNVMMALEAVIDSKENKHVNLFNIGFFNDSIVEENNKTQQIIINQLSDKSRLETDILTLKLHKQKTYLFGIIVITVFLLILFVVLSYNRKRARHLVDIEERTETLQLLLDKAVKEQASEINENFFRKILLQQLGIIKLIATNPTSQNQGLLQQMTRISSEHIDVDALLIWDDLYPIIDSIYDGFYTKVYAKYDSLLLEKEIQLCCLLCAEFSTKEISVVTQQSVRTIYQRKTNIRQKLSIAEKGDIVQFLTNL